MNELAPACAILALALTFAAIGPRVSAAGPDDQAARAAASEELHTLLDERDRRRMEEFPAAAMAKGDYSRADRLADTSLGAIERRHGVDQEHLKRLLAIQSSLLNEEDLTTFEIFRLDLEQAVEGHKFRAFLAPIDGRNGPQQDIPQMAERVRFDSAADYDNYLKRLEQVPKLVDDTIELLKTGVKEGRTPARACAMGVPAQFAELMDGHGFDALAKPFDHMPASISQADRERLRKRFDAVSMPAVRASVGKLFDYFVNQYLPKCRQGIAAKDWPDGEAFYNFQLRVMTTTDLTAKEIHELGLVEVKRIRAEMLKVIRSTDFIAAHPGVDASDDALFKAFVTYLRNDPRFYYDTPAALLSGYRDICKRVDAQLPKFFKTLPRTPYGVDEIPAFMAPQQTTAYYQSGDMRNAQPGCFMANTYDLKQRPKYEMITLAMHEAVPGHHLQISLAQEMEDQPEYRKDAWFNAFGEGWALYSERLAVEMGLLGDPYDDFGRLTYEMWRACRLVVDPGMHAFGWSREKAIQFMLDNTALSELNVKNEVDRYIGWPGQAVAYKIGELKIRELRERAEKALGPKFDIRAFHDVVLGAGSVPLNVLERRVNDWIGSFR